MSTVRVSRPTPPFRLLRLAVVLVSVSAALSGVSGQVAAAPEGELASFFGEHQAAFVMLDLQSGKYERFNEARCRERFRPCSTFKIPNALIGLETGVIPDAEHVIRWNGIRQPIEPWNRDHTLRTAFRDSVVWYFQELASRVGPERMRQHVRAIGYGDQDLSGSPTRFWLDSLEISPDEQVAFLRRLHDRKLPFARKTMDTVVDLMKARETERGTLHGKTGTDGDLKKNVATMGWYVGWVRSKSGTYLFAMNITGGKNPSGRTARAITERIFESRKLL